MMNMQQQNCNKTMSVSCLYATICSPTPY